VAADVIEVRPAAESDRRFLALLFAAVAEERDGIAAEPPIDVDRLAANWQLDGTLVALVADAIVGELRVEPNWFGFGEIGMMVAADWRGRGVGTALVVAADRVGAGERAAQADAERLPPQRRRDRPVPEDRLRGGRTARQADPTRERRALGPRRDGALALTRLCRGPGSCWAGYGSSRWPRVKPPVTAGNSASRSRRAVRRLHLQLPRLPAPDGERLRHAGRLQGGPGAGHGRFADYSRISDEADRKEHVFRFCPDCGSQVFYTEPTDPDLVVVSVGSFADPSFPQPTESGYDSRRHPWVQLPDSIRQFAPELWDPVRPLYEAGRYAEAADLAREIVAARTDQAHLYYNTACCESLAGRPADAVEHLGLAIELWDDCRYMARKDSDFDPIRDEPAFQELLGS
jgi:GNAT superfamily N-acetyltransferase